MIRTFVSYLAVGLICACTSRQDSPQGVAASSPTPTPLPAPESVIGRLEEFVPRVTFRRAQELTWQGAESNQAFYPLDALQTFSAASASIALKNGSHLRLSENAFVVLSPTVAEGADRAVVRNGVVKGRTDRELWLMTSAALFRLRANRRGAAEAKISIQDGAKLKVELTSGVADLSRLKDAKLMPPEAVLPRQPIVVEAPAVSGSLEDKPLTFPEAARNLAAIAAPPAALHLDELKDRTVVAAEKIDVKGRVIGENVSVTVNGREVSLAADGVFKLRVPLNLGMNQILIQMIREDGSSVFQRRSVIRRK